MTKQRRVNAAGKTHKHTPGIGTKPHKKARLGQNFLTDPGAAQKIVDALGDISRSIVIEIGPGRGAITHLLAPRAQHLIAIEYDRLLATQLRMAYARMKNVEIIEADVLSVDFDTLVQGDLKGIAGLQANTGVKARLVGNLPYYITSDILLKLFEFHKNFESIVIMVQREVAERVVATHGSRDYGLLSATAHLFCDVESLFTLPPGAFSPPPKVHSTVLRLQVAPKAETLGVKTEEFVAFLKLCFAQKRKTLANNLKHNFNDAIVRASISRTGLRSDVRAEAVGLAGLAALHRSLRTAG